jgi:hypothetical protein
MKPEPVALFEAAVMEFASMLKNAAFPTELTSNMNGRTETVVFVPAVSWVRFNGTMAEALESITRHGLIETAAAAGDLQWLRNEKSTGPNFNA